MSSYFFTSLATNFFCRNLRFFIARVAIWPCVRFVPFFKVSGPSYYCPKALCEQAIRNGKKFLNKMCVIFYLIFFICYPLSSLNGYFVNGWRCGVSAQCVQIQIFSIRTSSSSSGPKLTSSSSFFAPLILITSFS